MHANRSMGTGRRSSWPTVLAAIALVILSVPVAAGRTQTAAQPRTPRDVFTWRAPTMDQPAMNRPHAGRHVGVHFWLGGDRGLDVIEPGWPRAERVDCQTGVPIEGTRWRTHPYGSTGLEYDAETETYTYVWDVRPEWGRPVLRCRQFLLLLRNAGPVPFALNFRFRPPPSDDPPANLACANITGGDGAYLTEIDGVPLPEPTISFRFDLAAPSCASSGGIDTRYRLFALASDGNGNPTSWLPIAKQVIVGNGASDVLTFSMPVTEDPLPPEICLYGDVRRDRRIIETAPATHLDCLPLTLNEAPPGRDDWI